jgi:acetolactate synthase-1/2/3 large subunit
MFDQAGMVREHVKWDYELRSGTQIESVLDRALAIARSEPAGPVYLTLPREVMDQPTKISQQRSTQAPARPGSPDLQEVGRIAQVLAQAQRPLIITSRSGQDPEAVPLLAELAERWAWPVVEFRPRYLSLPSQHPLHGGFEVQPWLAEADAILVLDSDVPWIPSQGEPPQQVPVMHVGSDPLYSRYPTRGFRADCCLQARPAAFLKALALALTTEMIDPQAVARRRLHAADMARTRRQHLLQLIQTGRERQPMGMAAVSHALGQALAAQASSYMVINEYSLVPAALQLGEPGSYFGSSPVGGLGWGVPAALGAKLARPDALVVAGVGDGSYSFSNPLACHHAAAMHDLPILTLVLNNGGYGAVERATVAMYPHGRAVAKGIPLVSLQPMPRFEDVIKACGGWGERVERHEDLAGARQRAMHQVQIKRQQALLNVICA